MHFYSILNKYWLGLGVLCENIGRGEENIKPGDAYYCTVAVLLMVLLRTFTLKGGAVDTPCPVFSTLFSCKCFCLKKYIDCL